jgi:hypothetical protein
VTTKADQQGLVRVHGQFERTHPLLEVIKERLCLMLVLEADDRVICIADVDYVAWRLGPAPAMDPQVIHVVQVNIRQDW